MTTPLAEDLLDLVGGPSNVRQLTHCFVRLRFTLRDEAIVDEAALKALPGVLLVLHQTGQLQIALRTGLIDTYTEITKLL